MVAAAWDIGRSSMHRFTVAFLLVATALVSVVGVSVQPHVVAQEATPETSTMSTHPVVGAWRFSNEIGGISFPSLAIVHADGTYIEDYPDESSYSMGVWEPTGERTATITIYQVYVVDDKLVNGEGRFTAEVDETGNALTRDGTFVGTFEDGSIEFAAEGPTPATRLGILPVLPLETLIGTPVSSGEATPGASNTKG
jgi:hypothetical protein